MSLMAHEGWLFSEGNPPKEHIGGLFPKHAKGYIKPWIFLLDINCWYTFAVGRQNWFIRNHDEVPKEYLAQLLLIK